jgi:hypothetical protein
MDTFLSHTGRSFKSSTRVIRTLHYLLIAWMPAQQSCGVDRDWRRWIPGGISGRRPTPFGICHWASIVALGSVAVSRALWLVLGMDDEVAGDGFLLTVLGTLV